MRYSWFLFDLGNTIIKLAYERVIDNICKEATATRDELLQILEEPRGYREPAGRGDPALAGVPGLSARRHAGHLHRHRGGVGERDV